MVGYVCCGECVVWVMMMVLWGERLSARRFLFRVLFSCADLHSCLHFVSLFSRIVCTEEVVYAFSSKYQV